MIIYTVFFSLRIVSRKVIRCNYVSFSPKNGDAKLEIMKLYEQSKALSAAQTRAAVNHDSGISSAPSSAGGSVSSTDTNHGGSDEDLINFNQSWRHSKYDNWPPGKNSHVFL